MKEFSVFVESMRRLYRDGKVNKEKIIEILKEELKKDRTKSQIIGFSKLNLLELTRKHVYGE